MSVTIDGELPSGSGAKDIILAIIAKIGTNGAQGTSSSTAAVPSSSSRWRPV